MSDFGKDFEKLVVLNIGQTFPNADKRIRIIAETVKYNWKEDESVWNQKKGKTAPQYDAYFDGEFICFVDSSKGTQFNYIEFMEGLKKLYKDGKIYINKEMYDIKEAEEKAKRKEDVLIVPKAENEAEGLIVESIKKSAKKKGRKVVHK